MFSPQSKWILGGSLAVLLGSLSVTALANGSPGAWKERRGQELAQRIAAKAGLRDQRAAAFVKAWETAAAEQQVRRKQMKEAMEALAASVHAGKTGRELSRAVDGVQAAFLSILDGSERRAAATRGLLSPAEQSRLVLGQKWPRVLSLPGMKQAVPALIRFVRGEFLASVTGLDAAAKRKLEEISDAVLAERVKLVEERMNTLHELEAAGQDGKDNAALLARLADNRAALHETIAEQISRVRKSVPDEQTARVLLALKGKLGLIHRRAGALMGRTIAQD